MTIFLNIYKCVHRYTLESTFAFIKVVALSTPLKRQNFLQGWETRRETRVAEGYTHIQPLNIAQQEW